MGCTCLRIHNNLCVIHGSPKWGKNKHLTSKQLRGEALHEDGELQEMKEQSKQPSLAAKQAYINALEYHLKHSEVRIKELEDKMWELEKNTEIHCIKCKAVTKYNRLMSKIYCPNCYAQAESRLKELELELKSYRGQIFAVIHELGGMVEGHPTSEINFLQRIRQLTQAEARLKELEKTIKSLEEKENKNK